LQKRKPVWTSLRNKLKEDLILQEPPSIGGSFF
jgi:hypothetical protein